MTTDQATLANYRDVRVTHTHLQWQINWAEQLIAGWATLSVRPQTASAAAAVDKVVLDTSFLDIQHVDVDGKQVKWEKAERIEAMGEALTVRLDEPMTDEFKITIKYSTTKNCTALGWLTKEQTKGGKHPYLYSQSQAIHARSLLPCQDTPSIKSTYSASVKSTLPVLLSALRISPPASDPLPTSGQEIEYTYDQPVPIPSYLIAIASGNLAYRAFPPVPGRKWTAGVWTEPEAMEEAYWEFSEDIGRYIATAEDLTTPYEWGVYDTLVLPPSFPYGGMENTCLTFVTPVLIAHDRSLTDVCAHEIAHSWTGNLIGCASWNHFWLNEGWTTYLERMILNDMHGPAERDLSYIIGRKQLRAALAEMPPKYQKLVIDYERYADPDDGFSTVPYDKGSNFLLHIERTVGGLDVFRPYIKAYIQKFAGNVVTTDEWRAHLYDFFSKAENGEALVKKLDEIKWDEWLHGSGSDLPVDIKYDETLAQQCYDLANRWKAASEKDEYSSFSPEDIKDMSASQKIVFLESLKSEKKPLPVSTLKALDKVYNLDASTNGEIRLRWYGLALPAGTEYAKSAAAWVIDQGRMKMCRTVYRLLYAVAPELARDTFKAHAAFYHPIARKMIAKDLKLE